MGKDSASAKGSIVAKAAMAIKAPTASTLTVKVVGLNIPAKVMEGDASNRAKPKPAVVEVEAEDDDDEELEDVEDAVVCDSTQFDAAASCTFIPLL